MARLPPEQILVEIEDVIRSMPDRPTIRHETPENLAWWGRAAAVMHMWDSMRAVTFDSNVTSIYSAMARDATQGLRAALTMLHQAAHELRMKTIGPLTVAIGQGGVFDYFDEIRKVIEAAKVDILFVDPYLDAEFASRYLPHVSQGAAVRLLGRERIAQLMPAIEALSQQSGLAIAVRSAPGFHDRFLFVDGQACYQSGASFKDGAKKAPTTLTQIVDAFDAVLATYERLWASAAVLR